MIKSKFYCQIVEDCYGTNNTITQQRCATQCETCVKAKEQIRLHKKLKNKNDSKRYYLHSIVKKQVYLLNSHKRTIFISHESQEISLQVQKLRDNFNYSIQTYIT